MPSRVYRGKADDYATRVGLSNPTDKIIKKQRTPSGVLFALDAECRIAVHDLRGGAKELKQGVVGYKILRLKSNGLYGIIILKDDTDKS